MKILYASCRYDPLDRDAGSGVDFNIYEIFKNRGIDLQIVGPFKDHPSRFESMYRKAHRLFSRKLTAKFSAAYLRSCARKMDQAAQEFQPDVIFTHNLIPLVYCRTKMPIIYKSDAILKNMHSQWPTYSRLELQRMLRWEKAAVNKSAAVITASHWAEVALVDDYKVPLTKILVLPIPSSLPASVVPAKLEMKSNFPVEINLLLVAKDFHLKGGDIALQTVDSLRTAGYNIHLRVVGSQGSGDEHVQYLGLLKKNDPDQLAKFVDQYEWAHFLIHPARYEAAGIVCGEAAAFGVPTITNAIGGLATTVEDKVSGVVLPALSPTEEYVKVIRHYIDHPQDYQRLRQNTRQRYERELNWGVAGDHIMELINCVLEEHRSDGKCEG